jgi:hypothetical protein
LRSLPLARIKLGQRVPELLDFGEQLVEALLDVLSNSIDHDVW